MVSKSDYTLIQSIIDVIGFLLISAVLIVQSIIKYFLPKSYQRYKNLDGEVVLITGGGGGLGRLLALRFARLNAVVVLWDINTAAVEETVKLVKGVGGVAYGYKCDLVDKEDVYRVAKNTKSDVGDVTILINNAGVVSGSPLLETPDHLIRRTFDVNIISHFWTVKSFLPRMIEKNHGHIVTIASMAGFVGINKLVDYCSSKYAAVGFDEALRIELETLGVSNVKTSLICPYFIQSTGMFDNVNSRFLPTLKPNDVADRIVKAVRREEVIVMMPSGFQFGLVLKAIVPWAVASMFLRNLVPDAAPTSHCDNISNKTDKLSDALIKTNGLNNRLTSELNHRIFSNGKQL